MLFIFLKELNAEKTKNAAPKQKRRFKNGIISSFKSQRNHLRTISSFCADAGRGGLFYSRRSRSVCNPNRSFRVWNNVRRSVP